MTYRLKSVLLGSLLWTVLFSNSAISAIFTVSGTGGGLSAPWTGAPGTLQSSTPGLSLNEFQARYPSGVQQDVKWIALADAHSIGVFAEARTFQGATPNVGAHTLATFQYDDLIFDSAINTNISVTLALHYTGFVSARKVQGDGGQVAVAGIHNRVNLGGNAGTNSTDFNTSFPGLVQAACGSGCALGDIVTENYDQILTHTWNNVPTNTPISLEVGLLATTFVDPNFSQGGYATSDFSNTLTIANPGAVFTLPGGVTANSVEMGLTANVLVPEPSSGSLLLLSVFFCSTRRRRR